MNDVISQETEETLKKLFAAALLRNPTDAFAAARQAIPGDVGMALRASVDWVYDPVVLAEQEALRETVDAAAFLPGKADLQREVWEGMQKAIDPEIKLKYMEMYAKIIGAIQKSDGGGVTVVVGAMAYADHGSDEEWEAKAAASQALLQRRGLAEVEELEGREIDHTRH